MATYATANRGAGVGKVGSQQNPRIVEVMALKGQALRGKRVGCVHKQLGIAVALGQ
jgi:hypothetical protein